MTKLLIAEDDAYLARGLIMALNDSGYQVEHASTGTDADSLLASANFDLLVLDLGLPKIDGIEVLRRLRKRGSSMPVLILSARDSVEDRVQGLDMGANDYLVKPFHLSELEARIRALLRQTVQNSTQLKLGDIAFDPKSKTVTVAGQRVDLAPRELDVLEILLQHPGTLVSKELITDRLGGYGEEITHNAIDIAMHRLRKKLEPHGFKLKTVRGLGYVLQ